LALDVPRHLHLLTPASLRAIAEASGPLRVVSLRTLTRRARREREHVYAVRQTGDFHGSFQPTIAQSFALGMFSAVERAGNSFLRWGEEIELIAYRQ
jgi:hypothetical protein